MPPKRTNDEGVGAPAKRHRPEVPFSSVGVGEAASDEQSGETDPPGGPVGLLSFFAEFADGVKTIRELLGQAGAQDDGSVELACEKMREMVRLARRFHDALRSSREAATLAAGQDPAGNGRPGDDDENQQTNAHLGRYDNL
ncbi:hypothetical protein GQX73_g10300 [Xylaria multiplex]|uniref:Uncharacterized protein n=1 Tax=Xylaria multiplex TaxID=323545 RepID=A0A7C8N034_9PEZI|nr:hypothetical protein GQX73_g10300 [Xylaria multiplex]